MNGYPRLLTGIAGHMESGVGHGGVSDSDQGVRNITSDEHVYSSPIDQCEDAEAL